MKNKILRLILLITALLLAVSLCSCDMSMILGDGTSDGNTDTDSSKGNEEEDKDKTDGDKDGGDKTDGDKTDGNETEDGGDKEDGDKEDEIVYDPNKFQFVKDGVAQFNIVTTSEAGADAVRIANMLVQYLRNAGVQINNVVRESKAEDVTDYEIIVGTGARNRGEGTLSVDKVELGEDGYVIRSFGTKVIVAGGTTDMTGDVFERFIKQYLGIDMTEKVEAIKKVEFDKYIDEIVLTEYNIDTITVAGYDFARYVMFIDTSLSGVDLKLDNMQLDIYNASGYWIPIVTENQLDNYNRRLIVRYVEDAGEDGFRVYFNKSDLIVECAHINVMMDCFEEFMDKYILSKTGDVVIPSSTNYTKHVSTVKYSDFGAVGDGETDDYQAIWDTHDFANAGGQKVYADPGATYYIHVTPYPIVVRTDVDFGDAKIIIDDTGSAVYNTRLSGIFHITRDSKQKRSLYSTTINDLIAEYQETHPDYDPTLKAELYPGDPNSTKSIPWLADYIDTECMVRLYNSQHKDFIRNGSNENSGKVRTDVLLVDTDGNISSTTPVAYDFDQFTQIDIFRIDDKPITIEGGTFETISARAVADTNYKNKWAGYRRGFWIERANVTMKNIDHIVTKEVSIGDYEIFPEDSEFYYNPDSSTEERALYDKYGSRREGYAYNAFLIYNQAYNATLIDSTVRGRTWYYEEKQGTSSDGGDSETSASRINYVPQGTYDYVMEHSIGVTFNNVRQTNSITWEKYWGIMSSNGSKNLTFIDCYNSRFDAHCGFWNATIIRTTIGRLFHVVGGGTLYAEEVTVLTGDRFIRSRNDYGSTFRGNIYMKNCVLEAYYPDKTGELDTSKRYAKTYAIYTAFKHTETDKATGTKKIAEQYLNWDFGYACYMPINVVVDNYKSKGTGTAYLFEDIPDYAFDSETYSNAYNITQSIIYKNMTPLTTCPSVNKAGYTKMKAITVTKE